MGDSGRDRGVDRRHAGGGTVGVGGAGGVPGSPTVAQKASNSSSKTGAIATSEAQYDPPLSQKHSRKNWKNTLA